MGRGEKGQLFCLHLLSVPPVGGMGSPIIGCRKISAQFKICTAQNSVTDHCKRDPGLELVSI